MGEEPGLLPETKLGFKDINELHLQLAEFQ